ncbi:hypothetical protein A7981_05230 [Methylovorus sp. MM2]|uniref:SPOR domain-containing protein n=1 Tax=Methylovorus sp. MM2 TaxID=1848038 RepID=UPI0007E01795|nr:SPOR domain-containing protein [Methylovorus sp. MM2]OAM52843.1 hypothetical protein A7981_05230 [Methylovorus sp. MM2]
MPPDNLNEQELQFKKRARRRLVGAIALVLLMITVLPMVLDDRSSKMPQQDIAISIPSQDGAEFTSKIVPLTPDTTAQEEISDLESSVPLESTDAPEVASPAPVEPPKPELAEVKKPEVPTPAPVAKPEAPKPTPAPVKKETVVAKPPVEKDAAVKAVKEAGVAKGDVFSVQIGVFSDPANVKQLQQKLATQSLKSYTEKLPTASGEKIRLRAGPFSSRVDAEKALAKAKDVGLVGMIVTNK